MKLVLERIGIVSPDSNYHYTLDFCLKLKVTPLTSSLPLVVSFSYVQERIFSEQWLYNAAGLRTFFMSQ